MTKAQENLIIKLLCGHFLRTASSRGKDEYILYDKKVNPLMTISARTVNRIDKFINSKIKIWKKSKQGNITLNLSMIRRLHGRSTLKVLYKRKMELNDIGSIYKIRTKKTKPRNEKIYNLFGDTETGTGETIIGGESERGASAE